MLRSLFSHHLLRILLFRLLVATSRSSLYGKENGNDIVVFDSVQDFETQVLASPSIWMIIFDYDDDTNTNPNASKIAEMMVAVSVLMEGIFPVGFVNLASSETGTKQIADKYYDLKKYPVALILAGDDKTKPAATYDKATWNLQEVSELLVSTASKTIQERSLKLDEKFRGRSGSHQQQQSSSSSSGGSKKNQGPSKVVQLTSSNFKETVYDNPQVVMVAFTAPWCGHCQRLQPEWEDAAYRIGRDDGGAILGWVDATVEQSLASEYGVKGFPTIVLFPGGSPKSSTDAIPYQGERSAPSIVKAVLEEVDRTGVPPDIPQLLSQDMLEQQCAGQNHICVLAALPHILDSAADGRNKYRDLIRQVSKTFRGTSGAFSFLWFEGTSQPELEQALELTFGFPAIVAFSLDRKAYAVMRGAFTEKSITTFLHRITTGRQATIPLPSQTVPEVVTVTEWDGLDGEIIEEEMSLDEIMGWGDDGDDDEKKEDGGDDDGEKKKDGGDGAQKEEL